MSDRRERENGLIALMVKDIGDRQPPEMDILTIEQEVRDLSDEDLERTLCSRLGLAYPVDPEELDAALSDIDRQEHLSPEGVEGYTKAPDLSHEPRPEERPGG
jgi:hypothetical protein